MNRNKIKVETRTILFIDSNIEMLLYQSSQGTRKNRFTNRENGIKEWLVQNNAKQFLTRAEELLSSCPK
ncbi:hypothetical protein [Leptospira sp. Pond_2020]|uniref:hypothetical protein n=1 Tax=Leptospira sp. Pond_2020 TaxID=2846916 RepID=UPI001E2A2851|nr:hypothetical protein [Leptospira sp. Pond_2020]MCD1183542.1 hypothetical protein [Leptospira sp. Pond_2020]